ncbi:MAG: hypothetical protein IT232_00875 [Flavobacteriales bacterium]|nr:hypothetical protein [Flavobacteriales bacterium]
MKTIKYLFLSILFTGLSQLNAQETTDNCDATSLKATLKPFLMPIYKYDSSTITTFSYKSEKQGKEIEVPLFASEKYKLLFNASAAPGVEIFVYDKPAGKSGRNLLYTSKGKNAKEGLYAFEPEKSVPVYVTYIIPENGAVGSEGCIVFLMGYKF